MTAKADLLASIRAELRARLERLSNAARDAHAAATDAGSKAESKYDTRNLEASYLAKGQARQVEEIAEQVRIFETWAPPAFEIDAPIDAGALVEVDQEGETVFFLLAPAAGGLTLPHLDGEVTLLTPESPLYQKLVGLQVGDSGVAPEMTVTEVC